jgi:hypothetical protein
MRNPGEGEAECLVSVTGCLEWAFSSRSWEVGASSIHDGNVVGGGNDYGPRPGEDRSTPQYSLALRMTLFPYSILYNLKLVSPIEGL